jgi:hypothetical protein
MSKKVESKIVRFPKNEDLFSLRNKRMISRGPAGPIKLTTAEILTVLNQANRPTVEEVVVLRIDKYPTPKKIYSEPVTLTLQNYDLSYEEITGIDLGRVETVTQKSEPVKTEETVTPEAPAAELEVAPPATEEVAPPAETVEITDEVSTVETIETVETTEAPVETTEEVDAPEETTEEVETVDGEDTDAPAENQTAPNKNHKKKNR